MCYLPAWRSTRARNRSARNPHEEIRQHSAWLRLDRQVFIQRRSYQGGVCCVTDDPWPSPCHPWLCSFFDVTDIGAHLLGDPASAGKPCLLLVEDQPSEWFFYGDLLLAEYDVKFAMNGEEALAAVQRRLPDLILSDVLMPLLDGIGLAQRIFVQTIPADGTARTPAVLLAARQFPQPS